MPIDPVTLAETSDVVTKTFTIPAQLEACITWMQNYWWIFIPVMIWCVTWKALALYRAGKNKSPVWFVILFLVNTLGILEIVYFFGPGKKKK